MTAFMVRLVLCFSAAMFLALAARLPARALPDAPEAPVSPRIALHEGWFLQSSCSTMAAGDQISSAGFHADGWLPASVPSTVLGAQVDAGMFPDPFFGMNLRKIPGTDYPIGKIYANLPMTENSPYRCSWWYRTVFTLPAAPGKITWLRFNGINYRANVWVNGERVASADDVAGAYRGYEFDISKFLSPDGKNALAVEVFAQNENDLGINFIDWNPAPADKSLGLWRDVYLTRSGPVTLRNPAVNTRFTNDRLSTAELTVLADIANNSDAPVSGVVAGSVTGAAGPVRFQQPVQLGPREKKIVRFTPERFKQLRIRNPRVWWPYQYGTPRLETLRITFETKDGESDAQRIRFGIREVTSDLNDKGHRQFSINWRRILIRGAGWAPDMFYREPRTRLRQELEYVRHMDLNTVRLEGKLGSDDMFDLADEMGILIMAGWPCCGHWEHWEKWTPRDHEIAAASLYSQISRLRSHPSVFVWLNGSDGPPPAEVESAYIAILKERDWENPSLSSAAAHPTTVSGPSGVKMSGPYDYVPPEYWYLDKEKYGGAHGFNTETSPGPAIPSAETVRRTLPRESWWPIDDQWNFHAAQGRFAQYDIFTRAMSATYGEATSLEDYTRKAQFMTYEGERAMFEAYRANKYTSTGVIQWMLNDAWPSFTWHLYDYYLVPGGGFFGAKKANEPLHVLYRYDDRKVVVVNSTSGAHERLKVNAILIDLAGKRRFEKETKLHVAADGVTAAFAVPEQNAISFLSLKLFDQAGRLLSDNFYWLPEKPAQLDWAGSNYFYTPAAPHADLRQLAGLPQTHVHATASTAKASRTVIHLVNQGPVAALLLHLRAVKPGTDEEIVPVFWSDNFVSLLPGEAKEISVAFEANRPVKCEIKLEGWNAAGQTLRPQPAARAR